jgi:hypothetical protein
MASPSAARWASADQIAVLLEKKWRNVRLKELIESGFGLLDRESMAEQAST